MEIIRRRLGSTNVGVGWLRICVLWFLVFMCFLEFGATSPPSPPVTLLKSDKNVTMDNGIVQVTVQVPDGNVMAIKYNGIDNVLEVRNDIDDRGYWDIACNLPGSENKDIIDRLGCTEFKVIAEEENQVEISFTRTWQAGSPNGASINVDKRLVLTRGLSGLYTYAIFDRPQGFPDLNLDQLRTVYKLDQKKFRFMAVSDTRQRIMPTLEDRNKSQPLAYPEAVLLTNPADPALKGEVDDKYQYSCCNKDNEVHGWICEEARVGFWMITPSYEARCGGPVKQELSAHAGCITLAMFNSKHYAGESTSMKFRNGEPWKKVFGPVFVYLNSVAPQANPSELWANAKQQLATEIGSWPYTFPKSEDYAKVDQRGKVEGQLFTNDTFINKDLVGADGAFVGLAAPGEAGSWQRESKGYQFWAKADKTGCFTINNVRVGDYFLYAFVPGVIGDYIYNITISVKPGDAIKLPNLVYTPRRNGPTLWEIGVPDRSAAEFFVPDPNPEFINKLFLNHTDKFRQYGLWDRYTELFPEQDLVFKVGVNDCARDWFFLHGVRKDKDGTYKPTVWQIVFSLDKLVENAMYTLHFALASANEAHVEVRINRRDAPKPFFATGKIGEDNAIARHGIHGLYWLFTVDIPSSTFVAGENTIFLNQAKGASPFHGVMYDYIRLEGPPAPV